MSAQYLIEGTVVSHPEFEVAHLDVLDQWDEFNSVSDAMVLKSVIIDADGSYKFTGNELSEKDGFYRVRFTKNEEGVSINWLKRNYVNFIFSNQDTIQLENITYESSRLDNHLLEGYTTRYDTFRFKNFTTDNTRHQAMLLTKYQEYCLSEIEKYDSPLTNTFLLFSSELDIATAPIAFQKVVDGLAIDSIRPTYHSSLDKILQLYTYHSLEGRVQRWKYLAIAALLFNLTALVYLLRKRKAKPVKTLKQLTNKELEVLTLIKAKKTNKEIATELYVSEATIKTHINNIYRKLQINSRQEAIKHLNT